MFTALEEARGEVFASEVEAISAIRRHFAVACKHGQNIPTSKWDNTQTFLRGKEGKLVKGWRIIDCFNADRIHTNAITGAINGEILWLTGDGWIEQQLDGRWSKWQGSVDWWCAGATTKEMDNRTNSTPAESYGGGYTKLVDDAYVAETYEFEYILRGLHKAVEETKDRVPKRIAELQGQIAAARQVSAALSSSMSNLT